LINGLKDDCAIANNMDSKMKWHQKSYELHRKYQVITFLRRKFLFYFIEAPSPLDEDDSRRPSTGVGGVHSVHTVNRRNKK
jgi:hypothetical protein